MLVCDTRDTVDCLAAVGGLLPPPKPFIGAEKIIILSQHEH